MLDGNINGDMLTILIQKIHMNIQELKNHKIHHKQHHYSGPHIKILSIEYSLILNSGMKEAQEFKILSNYMYYQVNFNIKNIGASLFFYQFYELSAGFKILTFFPLAMFYTRLRDKCVDPDIK